MAEAKKRKGELNFASMTPMTGMVFELMCRQEGVNFRIVPYKGGADVATAILGGHADLGVLYGLQSKYLDTGKMRVLASAMPHRAKSAPNAPTIEELGYKGVAQYSEILFVLPRGVPAEARAKLEKAIVIAVKDPMFKDLVENKLLMEVVYIGGKGLAEYAAKKRRHWESVIKEYLEK